jgi:hypothetical protein
MNALIVLLFIIPGYIVEFLRQLILGQRRRETRLYQILRGMAYNIPLLTFEWIIIWFWKVILGHDWYMIQSLSHFWYKCINETFIAKYCLVLLVGVILYGIAFLICKKCRICRPPCHHPCKPYNLDECSVCDDEE